MANDLLKGKKGIIFGALNDQSIAWKTALQAHAQGAELVLTNAPVAMRMGEINNLSKLVGDAPVIPAMPRVLKILQPCSKAQWSTSGDRSILSFIPLA